MNLRFRILVAIRKVSISLPSGLYSALSQWAQLEDSNPTSLATDLVAAAIRTEISKGRLSLAEKPDESDQAFPTVLERLSQGERVDEDELNKAADELQIDLGILKGIQSRTQKKAAKP